MNPSSEPDSDGPVPVAAQPAAPAPAYARVPFMLGVTGNMDPVGYDDAFARCWAAPEMVDLRARLFDILDWVTGLGKAADGRCLDPSTGLLRPDASCEEDTDAAYHSCWKPLDLAKEGSRSETPVVILSSLAPGVDTLVVEAALEYAKVRSADIVVRCPLPFPPEIYENASSFNTEGRKARYREVLGKLMAEPWFDAGRDLFEVALDNDLLPSLATAERDLEDNDADYGKPRRHLRYRAAGEYVATHSDLLLAIYDVPFDSPHAHLTDLFEAGSATIVESKRTGLTHELLAVSNNFAWADNGPVLVMPVHRQKAMKDGGGDSAGPSPLGPLQILHPYDTQPGGGRATLADGDPAWQRVGDELFRRILGRQKEFNALRENGKESAELENLAGKETLADDGVTAFVRRFEAVARIRRRAADESAALDKVRRSLLKKLLGLIFLAALSFGAFEHWHNHRVVHEPHAGHPEGFARDPQSLIQCGLLVVTLGCLFYSGLLYYRYQKSGTESRRFDYRALGEALRVQFYWLLAGTGRGVAADYMQRQRDELDWIRYVVSSLAIPLEVGRREFGKLGHGARHRLLSAIHRQWIVVQRDYFAKQAPNKEKLAHTFHRRGWTLAAAGLLSIIFMLFAECSPLAAGFLHHHYLWIALPGLVAGSAMLWIKRLGDKRKHSSSHGAHRASRGFIAWILGDLGTWGGALAMHSLVLLLAFYLGAQSLVWPDEHNTWIILTGAVLLGGGLSVAWVERNFFSEEGRLFRSMGNLYACADRRLVTLLDRYERSPGAGPESERLLCEIQDIYYQIGCEALNENAEWLVQHRSRPLEPFMAG